MRKLLILTPLLFALAAHAVTAVTMVSPTPGSTLSSPSTTFTWAAGATGTTGYGLNVGTTGVGSANLVNIGPLQGTSQTVTFPVNYATIYVRLWTEFAGTGPGCAGGTCYVYNDYTYLGTAANPLTGFTCATTSATTCTVTLTTAAPAGGAVVTLGSGSSAVSVPASVTVPAGATTATFTATVNPVVTLTATTGSVAMTATVNLAAPVVAAYEVGITIVPPTTSPDPVVGYDVLRSLSGANLFQQVNAALVLGLAYTDATVTAGDTYQYEIVSVDAAGNKSVPSGAAQIAIP